MVVDAGPAGAPASEARLSACCRLARRSAMLVLPEGEEKADAGLQSRSRAIARWTDSKSRAADSPRESCGTEVEGVDCLS